MAGVVIKQKKDHGPGCGSLMNIVASPSCTAVLLSALINTEKGCQPAGEMILVDLKKYKQFLQTNKLKRH